MRSPRTISIGVVAALGLALVAVPPAATAATQAAIPSDFNGDGYADLAIGVPGENRSAGAVNVLYGSATGLTAAGDQYWTQDSPGVKGVSESDPRDADLPGDLFGRALASGDFDRDGYADLAIGAPGDGAARLAPPPDDVATEGAVNILYGSRSGLTADRDQLWSHATLSQLGQVWDEVGAAVASGDFDDDGYSDLAITGMRWTRSEEGSPITLAAIILPGGPGGLSTVGARPSTISADAAFGFWYWRLALVAGDLDADETADLAVGHPLATVDGVSEAGAVSVFHGTSDGLPAIASQMWTQDSPGIAEQAEIGDGFGSSLAIGDFDADGYGDLAVGVPQERTDTGAWVGAVSVIHGSSGGLTADGNQFWELDAGDGVPGNGEDDDDFGAALAAGDFDGDGADDLAIGAPGAASAYSTEDLDWGMILVLYGGNSGLSTARWLLWNQNSPGVPGTPEGDDAFGASLVSGNYGRSGRDDLVVGVPREDVGSVQDAGMVNVIYGRASGLSGINAQGWTQSSAGVKGTAESGDWFGWSLAP